MISNEQSNWIIRDVLKLWIEAIFSYTTDLVVAFDILHRVLHVTAATLIAA